jgi:hypothetical protein
LKVKFALVEFVEYRPVVFGGMCEERLVKRKSVAESCVAPRIGPTSSDSRVKVGWKCIMRKCESAQYLQVCIQDAFSFG